MRYVRGCTRSILCTVIVFGTMAIGAPGQAPPDQTEPQINALERQASALESQGRNAEALAAYEQAANLGSLFCIDHLGLLYSGTAMLQNPPQVTVDFDKAVYWFEKGLAERRANGTEAWGYTAAGEEIEIGVLLYKGDPGLPADQAQGINWIRRGLADGAPWASIQAVFDAYQIASPAPTAAQPTNAPQQNNAQQGTCAFVYSGSPVDPNGTEYSYGAAWSRTTIEDAQSAAWNEMMRTPGGSTIDHSNADTVASGCTFAHGAVAGKLKTQWQTGALLGPGIYDVITANLAATTNDAINTAMAQCRDTKGLGGDNEVCNVLAQW